MEDGTSTQQSAVFEMTKIIDTMASYLDQMPPGSRVTYPILCDYVFKKLSLAEEHRSMVNAMLRHVVATREDITVERGHGVCKRPL